VDPANEFYWSVSPLNPHLERYLSVVPGKLIEAAGEMGYSLDPQDIEWLYRHNGRYERFLPLGTKECGDMIKAVRKQKPSASDDEIEIHLAEKHHIRIGKSPRLKPILSEHSQRNYERALRDLWNFGAIVGNYRSLLPLLKHPPGGHSVCSMDPLLICQLEDHKFLEPFTPLHILGEDTTPPLRDIFGRHVLAQGTVQNCFGFGTTCAAVSDLHEIRKIGGSYRPRCELCYEKHTNHDITPCVHHSNFEPPQQINWFTGDPTKTPEVRNKTKKNELTSKARNYIPDSKTMIFPSDVMSWHSILKGHNYDLTELLFYTMTLGAIHKACRFDSYHDCSFSDFQDHHDSWMVVHGWVHYITQGVKEKNDKQWYIYEMDFNDTVKEHCQLRHLLTFIHCSNIGDGYVFPSIPELQAAKNFRPSSDVPFYTTTTCIEYDTILKWIQDKQALLDEAQKPHTDWANHSLRPSFYLWSRLGGATFNTSMRDARHRHLLTALKYNDDVEVIINRLEKNPEERKRQRVAPYTAKLHGDNTRNASRLNAMWEGRREVYTLREIARIFVENMLGIPPDCQDYKSPCAILTRSYRMNLRPSTVRNDFLVFANTLPEHSRNRCIVMFETSVSQEVERVVEERVKKEVAQAMASLKPPPTAQAQFMPPPVTPRAPPPIPENAQRAAAIPTPHVPPVPPAPPCTWVSPVPAMPTGDPVLSPRYLRFSFRFLDPDPSNLGKFVLNNTFLDALKRHKHSWKAKTSVFLDLYNEICNLVYEGMGHEPSLEKYNRGKGLVGPKDKFSKFIDKVIYCFYSCHNGDMQKFCATYEVLGKFQHSNFCNNQTCPKCSRVTR